MKTFIKLLAPFFVVLLALLLFAPVQAEAPACAGLWVHSHTLAFAPGAWSPGAHTYQIRITNPDGAVNTFPFTFEVTSEALLHRGVVELRFYGLLSIDGPVTEMAIHPQQDTVMELSWLHEEGLTQAERQAVRDALLVEFQWDDGAFVSIPAGPIMSYCTFDNPGRFMH
jgi:hypothetical protein